MKTLRHLLIVFLLVATATACEGRINTGPGDAESDSAADMTGADSTSPPSDTGETDTATDTHTPPTDGSADATDAIDASCDEYPAADTSMTTVAGRLDNALQVDGELDESAYEHLPALQVTDIDGDSDNEMTVQIGWTNQHIYLAVEVADQEIEFDSDLSLHQNDGIEIFFDTDHDGGGELTADDRHWILPAAGGEPLTERGSATAEEPNTDPDLDLVIERGSDGYVMEISAPLADLNLTPSDGDSIGLLVANNDLAGGDHHAFAWGGARSFKTPEEWGDLLFADPSCDSGGDTGTDAGDTGMREDADGGDEDTDGESCAPDADYEPTPVSGPANIGGGPDYDELVCQSDADTVVSTLQDLESALANASAGDVVFVTPDSTFDMGFDARLTVPSGVTLSGGRGCNCRAGALLYTDAIVKDDYDHETIMIANGDARVTGLRVRGPRNQRKWASTGDQDHYWDGSGIDAEGSDIEIDNNEIWGFAHAGINGGANAHVHHNYLHTMPRDGLGYGVSGGDEILIEHNYFEFVRHAVASGGRSSYTARYNHMGTEAISHVFDMHKAGGETIKIHHNTIEAVDNAFKNKNVPGVTVRGTPSDIADIHHNWFYNPKEPRSQPTNSWTDEAIVQMHVTSWSNVDFSDNHYGSSDPGDCNVGAPRNGC